MNQSEKDFYRDCGYDIPEDKPIEKIIALKEEDSDLIVYADSSTPITIRGEAPISIIHEEAGLINQMNKAGSVVHLKARQTGKSFIGNQIYSYLKDLWRNEPTTDRAFKLYTGSKGATMFQEAVKEVTEEDYKQVTEPFK